MSDTQSILENLGLGAHESLVYAHLLENGDATATDIARNIALARSSVYTTIATLTAKGLVGSRKTNTTTLFVASPLEAFETLLEEEKLLAQKRLALLSASKNTLTKSELMQSDAKPETITFSGQEGLKRIYLMMLREAKRGDILLMIRDEFVWEKSWQFVFGKDWHERVKRIRKEKNISAKLLVNNSATEKARRKFYTTKKHTQVRVLPKSSTQEHSALYILGNTLCILSIERNNTVGIFIRNTTMSKNMRALFHTLWSTSETLPR